MEEVDNVMNERMENSIDAQEAERTLIQIKECIKYKDIDGLQTHILDKKSLDKMICWEICTDLIECLTEYSFEEYEQFFEMCEKCMLYVVEKGNAKENLVIILENLDKFNDDTRYKTLLRLLQPTMLRLPPKMNYGLDLALETVAAHLQELKLPEDHQLEGDEKKLLDLDPDVFRITDCLQAFLHFVKPFVEALSLKNKSEASSDLFFKDKASTKGSEDFRQPMDSQTKLMLKVLLKTLDHPLAFMDLAYNSKEGKSKSSVRVCAERAVQYICQLKPDIHKLMVLCLEHNETLKKEACEVKRIDETVPILSLACLAYLVNVEAICIDNIPSVFSPEFKLEFYLQFITSFVERQESLLLFKGIGLLQKTINLFPLLTLPSYLLENSSFIEVIDRLISVTIYCPVNEIRLLTLQVITDLARRLSLEGRFRIMLHIFNTCKHAGFKGYTIQLLKEQIDNTLKEGTPSEFFIGKNLQRLLSVAMFLPDGPATDLLEHSDQVMATLNLLRYLVIRDPPSKNVSGVWNFKTELEEKFLGPVQKGLDLSKAHYELELKNVKEKKGSGESSDVEFSVTVCGQNMDSMPKAQKIQVLKNALNTFDMMNSILCRVIELFEAQKRSN